MRIGDLKIGIRLGISFSIMIALTVIVSLVAVQNMKFLSTLTTKLYKHPYTVSTATLRIDGNIVKMHRSMKDVALARDAAGIDAAAATVRGFEDAVYKDFDIIAERFLGDKKQVNDTRQLFADWKPIRDEVIALMRSGDRQKAAEITKGKGARHVRALNKAIKAFEEFAEGKAEGFVKNADAARSKSLYVTYFILVMAVLIGVVLAFIMTRGITIPLKKAVEVADRLAENDLTMRIEADRRDETGQLLRAMETMVENLSQTISANIAASEALSAGASEQASSIEETSSSLEEMASMTKQNAGNAREADNLMKDANQVVVKANESMADLTQSMEDISKASEETSKIIKTIDEIAFQTNLLALNAAVEAARAGEAGAGFAVVADEVRNLAMRAADAAKNTATLIEGTVKKVTDGSELVVKTNEEFTEVSTSSTKVGELVAEIAAASNEQSQGIEQINTAVAEMDKVVQQNAAGAEEMAASMAVFKTNHDAMAGTSAGNRKQYSTRPANPSRPHIESLSREDAVSPSPVIPMDDKEFKDF